jgi:ribosomal protein S18 acetylase RimI-like enzyme
MRPDGMAEGYRWWLTRELENAEAVILVGEVDATIRGFVYGRLEERDFSALLDAHGALHDVWVEDRARGGGLGRALVEGMVAALSALGATRVVLKTAAQNEGAQRLFAALGWRTTMLEMTRDLQSLGKTR